ncbi:aldose epimerase family protein [Psittacicella hinzii]|uniref:Aldose 1-epimerase n=1 Tax=Psittacicella hinzii TaxID=2028575 RepID=A0A3A1YNQ1_9GAMM|nr:galactose mutarotase [Psittacicella hinzii]RIY38590.1 hypothetical protein CKF58_03970 [Psittacicella hinzii]
MSDHIRQQVRSVEAFVLKNKRDTQVTVLNLGGIVHEFVLNASTRPENLLVCCNPVSDYLVNPFNINKQIGRVAGRIAQGRFELEGKTYQVEQNNGSNCLHGGSRGMGNQWFTGCKLAPNKVRLNLTLTPQMDGFPGTLELVIDYLLTDDNQLKISYTATATQQATVFDPTIHTYWQINPLTANLRINGQHWRLDENQLPVAPDEREIYNFQNGKNLQTALQALRQTLEQSNAGYDEVYQVNAEPNLASPIAELHVPHMYDLKVYSDRNALVMFTANPLDVAAHDEGLFDSIALEPQTLPNSLNRPEFGQIRLMPGQTHKSQIVFAVSALK